MDQQSVNLFDLQLDPQALSALNETARWNKFMSIVWFVFCGLMAAGAIFFGAYIGTELSGDATTNPFAGASAAFVSLFYLFITAIQFIPTIFRYKFSVKMIRAIRNTDQLLLNESLNQLRNYSKYWGIVTIIVVSLYAIGFIFLIFGLLIGMAAGGL